MSGIDKPRREIDKIDKKMARLFEKRLTAVEKIARYKAENGLPITDTSRENAVIKSNTEYIKKAEIRDEYVGFIKDVMRASKTYQQKLKNGKTALFVNASNGGYNVYIEKGALNRIDKLLDLDRQVLIVTDDGVPGEYVKAVSDKCMASKTITLKQGERSKNADNLIMILTELANGGWKRGDCVTAVGGGMTGDIACLAASMYMRGIDFYNIPTTLLAQVDASVGGKCAIDFSGYKNTVGAFYPPRAVVIDTNTLKTLAPRQLSSGLAECVKMALTSDADLFSLLENGDVSDNIEEIIYRSLTVKKRITEADERENGQRRILNFGHTIAHAMESMDGFENLYHGECVALGMLPVCGDALRERVKALLEKLSLPTVMPCGIAELTDGIRHDKKCENDGIYAVFVNEIGKCEITKMSIDGFIDTVKERI